MIQAFSQGVSDATKALWHLKSQPSARRDYAGLIAGYTLLVLAIQSLLIYLLFAYVDVDFVLAPDPSWWQELWHSTKEISVEVGKWLSAIAIVVFSPIIILQLIGILLPALNEHIFMQGVRTTDQGEHLARTIADHKSISITRAVIRSTRQAIRWTSVSILIVVLGFVPGLGLIADVSLWMLGAGWFGYELFEPVTDRFDGRVGSWYARGFGIVPMALLGVPVIGPVTFVYSQLAAGAAYGQRSKGLIAYVPQPPAQSIETPHDHQLPKSR